MSPRPASTAKVRIVTLAPHRPLKAAVLVLAAGCALGACSDSTSPDDEFTGWTQVTVGSSHACALTNSGQAYCWGDSSDGQAGLAGGAGALARPTAIDTERRFVAIDAGGFATCGLTAEGRLFCWGDNSLGQLGNGGIADSPRPWEVEGEYTWSDVSVGSLHVCAVESGGTMLCWGGDRWDMVLGYRASQTCPGLPGREARMLCAGVPTPVDAGGTFTWVETSIALTCGGTAAGAVCWGSNQFGELGRASTGECATTDPVHFGTRDCAREPGPPDGPNLTSIYPGTTHACGLASGGTAHCWGALFLNFGQLGSGTLDGLPEPTPVVGLDALSFLATSPGNHISTFSCGIDGSGTGYCWGANTEGQLGANSTDDCGPVQPTPCALAPIAIDTSAGLQSIALGNEFACGLTLGGEILCWGINDRGQLGDGSTIGRQMPAAVLSP